MCYLTLGETLNIRIENDRFTAFSYSLNDGRKSCGLQSVRHGKDEVWQAGNNAAAIIYPGLTAGTELGRVNFTSSPSAYVFDFVDPDMKLSQFYCGQGLTLPKKIVFDKRSGVCRFTEEPASKP